MLGYLLERDRFNVVAWVRERGPEADDEVPILEFLHEDISQHQYRKVIAGIEATFREVAESGTSKLREHRCHPADAKNGIYQFIRGDLRVLWFWSEDERTIICTGGCIKKGMKTDKKALKKAIRLRKEYFGDGCELEVIIEHEDGSYGYEKL